MPKSTKSTKKKRTFGQRAAQKPMPPPERTWQEERAAIVKYLRDNAGNLPGEFCSALEKISDDIAGGDHLE